MTIRKVSNWLETFGVRWSLTQQDHEIKQVTIELGKKRGLLMDPRLSPGCFYAKLSKGCEISGLGLAEIVYPPRHKTFEHAHERAYFSLTLQGEYTKLYRKQSVPCTPETLVFHPPGQKQSGYCEKGGRSFIIEIAPRVLGRLEHPSVTWEELTISRGGALTWLATRLYKEFRLMDELSPLAIEGLALEMIVQSARGNIRSSYRTPPFWLEQTKEVLHTCFSENLSLVHIAESVGVHPVHMAAEFRRFYKSTMGEYIRRLRVDFACREISQTHRPLSQIALAAGFSSQSHLCTAFRRVTGMTPAEYRSTFRSPSFIAKTFH